PRRQGVGRDPDNPRVPRPRRYNRGCPRMIPVAEETVTMIPSPWVDPPSKGPATMPPGTIRSKVVGVTFANDDGSDRQTIIRRFCRAGKSLEVRPEPENPHSSNAIGLWVKGRRFIVLPAQYQIGHINDELVGELRQDLDQGCQISVRILNVTGGG